MAYTVGHQLSTRLLFIHHLSSELAVFALAKIPRLAVRLCRPQVKGIEAIDIEVAARQEELVSD